MMLRKIATILFLTFASMIILAFAVIPHHHHQEYICFNSLHCDDPHPTDQHEHDESPFNTNHGCVKNLFQTQISRIQSSVHACDEDHCFHFVQISFLPSDILTLLSLEAGNKAFPSFFYQEKLPSSFYTSDLIGRAPPVS